MSDVAVRLLPVVLAVAAGLTLRSLALADARDGQFLLRLAFTVTMPALLFASLATVQVDARLAAFPLTAVGAVSVGYGAGRLVASGLALAAARGAVFVSSCMIVNAGFVLPFVQALHGAEGVARLAAFDAVNAVLTFSWGYAVAAGGNPRHAASRLPLGRLTRSPALLAVVAGLVVNVTGVVLPGAVQAPLVAFGATTGFLFAVGAGILFTVPTHDLRVVGTLVTTRLLTGLLVGGGAVLLFDLEGVDRSVVLLLSVAPVGFVSVTFAAMESLDVDLAARALSLSLSMSLVMCLLISLATGP